MTALRYLIGPEIIWFLVCVWAGTLRKINIARSGHFDKMIESYATFLPVIMVALTMCLYAIPVAPRKYLMLRIAIVALVGTHFLLDRVLNAHTQGGPGVGMIYLVGYILLLFAIPAAIVFKALIIK